MEMKRVTGASDGQGPEKEGDTDNVQPTTNGTPIDAEEMSASDEDSIAGEDPSDSDQDSEEELDDEDIDHASADDESSDGEASPSPTQARARLSNGIGAQIMTFRRHLLMCAALLESVEFCAVRLEEKIPLHIKKAFCTGDGERRKVEKECRYRLQPIA